MMLHEDVGEDVVCVHLRRLNSHGQRERVGIVQRIGWSLENEQEKETRSVEPELPGLDGLVSKLDFIVKATEMPFGAESKVVTSLHGCGFLRGHFTLAALWSRDLGRGGTEWQWSNQRLLQLRLASGGGKWVESRGDKWVGSEEGIGWRPMDWWR